MYQVKRPTSVRSTFAVFILATFGMACSPATDVDTEKPATARTSLEIDGLDRRPAEASMPFDIDAVIQQVQNAYREVDGRFVGGQPTYSVEVNGGAYAFTPHHFAPSDDAPTGYERRSGAALTFETVAITRGENDLARDVVTRVNQDDGHLEIVRKGAVEHLRNSEENIEQSWSFATPPAGEGDLFVRVSAAGQELIETSETGLHFVTPGNGIGVRYSHGVWIDAKGVETPIQSRWNKGVIELVVPANVLAASSFPALLDPTISPEFGVDVPTFGPPRGAAIEASVASDGAHHLVVWQDDRNATSDVFGALIDATGTNLTPSGLGIEVEDGIAGRPTVASNGTNFFVVWEDALTGAGDLRGTILDTNGNTVVPAIDVETGTSGQSYPAVASDGTNFFVVWRDDINGGADIYGALVGSGGAILASSVPVTTAVGAQLLPAVASNGSGYFVAWTDLRNGNFDIFAALVDGNGGVSMNDIPVSINAASQNEVSIASDGSNYLLAWRDTRTDSGDIYGALLSATGGLITADLVFSAASTIQEKPSVASNGTNYFVAWQDRRNNSYDVYGALLDTNGGVSTGSIPLAVSSTELASAPVSSSVGTNFFVAWQDDIGRDANIYGVAIDGAGATVAPGRVLVSSVEAYQTRAAVSARGSEYFVAWIDERDVNQDIYGAIIETDGTLRHPAGIVIETNSNINENPSVATDGTNYLVVWRERLNLGDPQEVRGALVTPAGVLLASSIDISANSDETWEPAVASNGSSFLVVWRDHRVGEDIYGALVDTSGTVIVGDIAIDTNAARQFGPTVASEGTNYLVAWIDQRGGTHAPYRSVIDSNGAIASASAPIATPTSNANYVEMTTDGTRYLAVWQEGTTDAANIYGTFVDASGTSTGNVLSIFDDVEGQYEPNVAWNGSQFLVAWWENDDIAGALLDSAGARTGLLDISSTALRETQPVVAGTTDQFLVVYQREDIASARLGARLIDKNEPPVATEYLRASSDAIEAEEGQVVSFDLVGTDADGDQVTFELLSNPANGTLSASTNDGIQAGVFDGSNTTVLTLTYTATSQTETSDAFTFQIDDGNGGLDIGTVEIDITLVNDAPVITSTPPAEADQDTPYTYEATAEDPEGGAITWTTNDEDTCGGAISADGTYTFTAQSAGDCVIGINACDDGTPSACTAQDTTISVEGDADGNDRDSDGIDDTLDNCVELANPGQEDFDQDGIGDVCDPDSDGDGIDDADDDCVDSPSGCLDDDDQDGDGGTNDGNVTPAGTDEGCGCASASSPSNGLLGFLVLLFIGVIRRRD